MTCLHCGREAVQDLRQRISSTMEVFLESSTFGRLKTFRTTQSESFVFAEKIPVTFLSLG